MHIPYVRVAILAAVVLLLSACTSTSVPGGSDAASSSARGPAAGGATGATGDGSVPAAPAAGGNATTNACGLLTVDEIEQAVGFAVNPGVLQNSDNQSDCEWEIAKADTGSVGLTVSAYDDFMWQAGSSAGNSKSVSGVGDAAFKDWPTAASLNIKAKGYDVVLTIADFEVSQDLVDAGNLALAKLVLPRL